MTEPMPNYQNWSDLDPAMQEHLKRGPLTEYSVKRLCALADRLDEYALKCDGRYPDSYVGYEKLQAEAADLRTLIAILYPRVLRAHEVERHARQHVSLPDLPMEILNGIAKVGEGGRR